RSDGMSATSFSEPFIRRPVGTTLLAIGLFLVGAVAYRFLPVASMPTVDFPTISITANRPGADPETMAATVAAPLERRLGEIDGVAEVTVYGAEQPAIRVRVNPIALASMGLNMEDVRTAIANSNGVGPVGMFDGSERVISISTNDQLRTAREYDPIIVRSANG